MKVVKLSDYKSTVAREFITEIQEKKYKTILADPPWRFQNRTGKMAPEHKRLSRYPTLSLDEIKRSLFILLQTRIAIYIYGFQMHY